MVLAQTKRCSRGLGLHKRNPGHECWVQDTRHDQCGNYLHYGEAPGCDIVPVEAYRGPVEATKELFRICRLMWHTERIPPEIVRCMFVMQRNVKWGAVAEWVERRSLNPEVLGSNPTDAVSNLGQVRLPHVAIV